MTTSAAVANCPVCEGGCRPWTVRGGRVYAKCRGCGTAHMMNPPDDRELAGLYEHSVFTLPGNNAYYDDDRTNIVAARERLRWIERTIRGGALLDIGCGYGHFLSILDRARWEASGIDLSPHVIAQARNRFNVRCEARTIDQLPRQWNGTFDVVTLWDVLEHVPRPVTVLRRATALLKPGGRIYLSTPDISSLVAKLLGSRWHHLDPMQHLTLFSRSALARLCRRVGLAVARQRTFGRSYTADYLAYRAGYSYPVPGLKSMADLVRRCLGRAGRARIPLRLGDVVAVEAIRPASKP